MNFLDPGYIRLAKRMAVAGFAFALVSIPEQAPAACLELSWQDVLVSQSPSGRRGHAMAYDSFRGLTILFGGLDTNDVTLNDTWQFDHRGWKRLQPAHSPPARFRHTLSYDASRGVIVLFGGVSFSGGALGASFGDVWEWNGTDWQAFSVEGEAPAARFWHGMAFDSMRGLHVLFGGYMAQNQEYGDTWEYDGNLRRWISRATAISPSARRGTSLSFDAARNQMLLFGGYTSSGVGLARHYLSDTWLWDGLAGLWLQQNPRTVPRGRALHGQAYDSVRSIILMQNGEIAFDELQTATVRESWEWDGTSWSEHYSYCCPRREAALVYELSHQRMIMFGGNGAYPDRTWELAAVWNYQHALQVAWQYPPGTFPNTYQTVRQALDVAGDCTFIDIRGGDYNETASGFAPLVITKAVRFGAFRLVGDSPTVRIH